MGGPRIKEWLISAEEMNPTGAASNAASASAGEGAVTCVCVFSTKCVEQIPQSRSWVTGTAALACSVGSAVCTAKSAVAAGAECPTW